MPVGVLAVLAVCFATDKLFRLGSLPFPASVAVLIVLFFGLLLSEWLLGEHRTRRFVGVVEIPVCVLVFCSHLINNLAF